MNKIAALILAAFFLVIYAVKQEAAKPQPIVSEAALQCFIDQRDLFGKDALSALRFCKAIGIE